MRKGSRRGMLKQDKPTKLRERPYLEIRQSKFATELGVCVADSCNNLYNCMRFVLQNSEFPKKEN